MGREEALLRANLEILRGQDPVLAGRIASAVPGGDLFLFEARNGSLSIRVGGVALHSGYDPQKEAADWVGWNGHAIEGAKALVVLGFGLGYHLAALVRTTDAEITVFEPRIDLLRAACGAQDLSEVLARVHIVTDDELSLRGKPFWILPHRPSMEASAGFFARLLPRLEAGRAVRRGLRIAVVGPIQGGSLPIAGYCAEALCDLGHDARLVDNSALAPAFEAIEGYTTSQAHRDILRARFVEFASEASMARLVEIKPDLVLAVAQAPLADGAFRALAERKVPLAYWFVEDFRLMAYWRSIAPRCDWFFTIQRGSCFDALAEAGVRHFAYLPPAASPGLHRVLSLSDEERRLYGSDVSFVGAGYHNRRRFFEGLLDFDFKIWGNEWDLNSVLSEKIQRGGERIPACEIVRIFNAAKINLNLHSSPYHDGVNPHGDFVNPRLFEIAACGAFQLVDFRSELPLLFDIGKEMVCFEGITDLRRKIAWYLDHPEERCAVAGLARARVLREHTYRHRMETLLDFIVRRGYEPPRWGSGERGDPEDLVREAGPDTELGRYLAQFAGRPGLVLADVVEAIRAGEGTLTPVERMFLALDELNKWAKRPRAGEGR